MAVKTFAVLMVLFYFVQVNAKAETIVTTIFNVFESKKQDKLLILSGRDGRIYKIPNSKDNIKLYQSLTGAIVNLNYVINNQNEAIITSVTNADPAKVKADEIELNMFRYNELRQFAPTELKSPVAAAEAFNSLNDGDKGRSQCYNRAHMWAYELWSKRGITSEKIFIFYTKRYFLLEKFDWWFHVAPLVSLEGGKQLVLDRTFMEKPIDVKGWLNFFMKTDKITCPEVQAYQDYENSHWNKLCVHMKVPMFMYDPMDIEKRDKEGMKKNHWEIEELMKARKAFKDWDKTYEGIDNGKSSSILDKVGL